MIVGAYVKNVGAHGRIFAELALVVFVFEARHVIVRVHDDDVQSELPGLFAVARENLHFVDVAFLAIETLQEPEAELIVRLQVGDGERVEQVLIVDVVVG